MTVYITRANEPARAPPSLTETAIRKRLRRQGRWLRKARSQKSPWLYRVGDIGSNDIDGEAVSLAQVEGWLRTENTGKAMGVDAS